MPETTEQSNSLDLEPNQRVAFLLAHLTDLDSIRLLPLFVGMMLAPLLFEATPGAQGLYLAGILVLTWLFYGLSKAFIERRIGFYQIRLSQKPKRPPLKLQWQMLWIVIWNAAGFVGSLLWVAHRPAGTTFLPRELTFLIPFAGIWWIPQTMDTLNPAPRRWWYRAALVASLLLAPVSAAGPPGQTASAIGIGVVFIVLAVLDLRLLISFAPGQLRRA